MYLFCISGLEGYYFIWSTINYPSEWWAETVYIGTIFYDLHKKKYALYLNCLTCEHYIKVRGK